MANTSATGGTLTPNATPAPLEGQALVDFLQGWVVGICGLPGNMVRPRWQPESVNIPADGTDWAAFGIRPRDKDAYAAIVHGNGVDQLRRHEVLDCLISFYGPNADDFAERLSDGMQVAQNREPLTLHGMGLVSCGGQTAMPELVKEKWLYRVDLPFSLRRQVVREYPVLNIAAVQSTVNTEVVEETVTITGP